MNSNELEIHENPFPFVCGNRHCKHEYDLEALANVVLLWGFIYLKAGEHVLMGMTCPDCHQTTVRKYPESALDGLLEALEKQGTATVNNFPVEPSIRHFVPFSPRIIGDLAIISPLEEESDQNPFPYRIPFGFEPLAAYPKSISKEFPYSIQEESVPALAAIENEKGYKAFPRIVSSSTLYGTTDIWLAEANQLSQTSPDSIQDIHETFFRMVDRPVPGGLNLEPPRTAYDHLVKEGLSADELKNVNIPDFAYERDSI